MPSIPLACAALEVLGRQDDDGDEYQQQRGDGSQGRRDLRMASSHICFGKVVAAPADTKSAMVSSSKLVTNANRKAAIRPDLMSGTVICQSTRVGDAPRLAAA